MNRFYKTIPWLIILLNLPAVYFTSAILFTDGGNFGIGWLLFPEVLYCSLFSVPAIVKLIIKNTKVQKALNVLNLISLPIVTLFFAFFIYTQFD